VRAVAEDIGVDAVKIGMLGNAETIQAVRDALELVGDAPVVLDPVMVAESGAALLEPDAREALVRLLLPLATVVTPNVAEAQALAGAGEPDTEQLARAVHALGPRFVVVTGGHGDDPEQAVDLFFDGARAITIVGPRHPSGAAHGSGCTHSSVLAAQLALGADALAAAREAKRVAAEAVRGGLSGLGAGAGPVDVFGLAHRRGGGQVS
jgi:hydroxymethylpyrimidine/phosphomethylpyrimidine kinase